MKMICRSHTPHGASACRHGPRVRAGSTQTPRCLVGGGLVAGGQGLRGVSSSVSPPRGTVPLPRQGCLKALGLPDTNILQRETLVCIRKTATRHKRGINLSLSLSLSETEVTVCKEPNPGNPLKKARRINF